jgi:transposase
LSNGPAKGWINGLKTVKRRTRGRASLGLFERSALLAY